MPEAAQLQRVQRACAVAFGSVGELDANDSRGCGVRPLYLAVK
jgi:hypothetical protein